jgi:hypothetical protein
MSTPRNIDVLNRLLAIHHRALPQYLSGVSPWTHTGDERAEAVMRRIVSGQQATARKIAELILDRGGRLDSGSFPMDFTELNLLSLDYLLKEVAEHQSDDIWAIEQCVAALADDPEARTLAEESLGAGRAYLESLHDVIKELV